MTKDPWKDKEKPMNMERENEGESTCKAKKGRSEDAKKEKVSAFVDGRRS